MASGEERWDAARYAHRTLAEATSLWEKFYIDSPVSGDVIATNRSTWVPQEIAPYK